jgi:hypothetical protein
MAPNKIPEHIKQMLRNKEMTMSQKMVAFMAHMPGLPNNNPQFYIDNLSIGKSIKRLIDENKISFDGFDDAFKLQVTHLDKP